MKSLPYARETRFRCLATLPGVAIAGAALGVALADSAQVDSASAALWFAVAMCVASYLSAILEVVTLLLTRTEPESINADVVGFGWDLVFGLITGAFLARLLPVTLLEGAGAASAILFLQRIVLEKFVLGNLVGDTFTSLLHGGGMPAPPDYSRAATLAVRGEYELARTEYEQAIAAMPDEPRAYLALARMLRSQAGDHAGAATVMERTLALKRLDPNIRTSLTRELAELHMHYLGNSGRAAVILGRYISTQAGVCDVQWARTMLRSAKGYAAGTDA
jgi:hypothetical protein